jgi:hypothetical protein
LIAEKILKGKKEKISNVHVLASETAAEVMKFSEKDPS